MKAPLGMSIWWAMLVGPTEAFPHGRKVPMTLRFERAGDVVVELSVEAPGARADFHEER